MSPQGASGPAGAAVLNGAGAPSNGSGANGDFYLDTTNTRLYGPKAAGAWPGGYVSLMGVPGSDATVTAANTLTALQTMTAAQEKSSRVAIAARSRAIGFYHSFEDPVLSPDGSTITHKVTSPKVGNPWYRAANDVDVPFVFGGFLRTLRDGGYYLAGHATPEDITNFSYGFEFVRELVPQNVGGTEATLTITIGSGNLVQEDGTTHNAPGNFHLTISEFGVKQAGLYQSSVTVSSATAATDLFTTSAAHGLETGDYIGLAGAGLATAGITAANFYAIKVSDTTFKAASTRALAQAGTAVDVTANSTGTMTVERALESMNRVSRSGYHSFIEDANMRLPFQGSNASDNLAFDTPPGLANGDPVFLEGSGLPGGLSTKTKYFVVNTQPLTVQLASTLGGTAIVLSSDGSASQTLVGPRRDATSCVPANRKSLLIFTIKGDYLTIDLAGVGAVQYYWRNLAAIFSGSTTAYGDTVGFYYQSVPPSSGATSYTATFPLANVWIDAPEVEEYHRRKHAGYVAMLASGSRHKLPGRLDLTNPNEDAIGSISQSLGYANTKLYIGAAGRTSLGSSRFRFTGGNGFAEGAYLSTPGFTDSTLSQVAIAPASIDASRSAAISSATTGSEVRLDDWETFMTLQTGDMETHRLYGNLVGAGTKRIRIAHYNAPSTTIFDSNVAGTPLNGLAVPFEIVIHRLQTAAATHLTWVTMYVNGTVIGPQRTSVNMSMNYQYFSFWITQSVASEIVLESILQTLHRTQRP